MTTNLDFTIKDGKIENYINGQFSSSSVYIESENPSNGQILFKLPDSNEEEVNNAVLAAKDAFPNWSNLSITQRSVYLCKIADLIEANFEAFALAESKDQGKPVSLAKLIDIPRAILNFRAFASSTQHILNKSIDHPEVNSINYTLRKPIGVVALISPWNLPIYLLTFKIAPALSAGCTIIAKPSEMTSWTAWMLANVINAAKLPPGVCNFVFGTGLKTGMAILRHPGISGVSFTGSTATGEIVSRESAPFFRKLSLELGGKNAGIVFDDANLDKCMAVMMKSSYANQGEVCLCTSRIYVQEGIYDKFLKKFIENVKNIVVGTPSDPKTAIGALISKQHWDKVNSYVELAEKEGGRIEFGHTKDTLPAMTDNYKNGFYMLPTVITGLTDSTKCMQDEIFGPVVCISPFKNESEVIERANCVKYGLCASVWTENLGVAHRIAKSLDVGTVWINCWLVRNLNIPFGGVKHSGIGREGINESFEFFTEVKTVCIQHD